MKPKDAMKWYTRASAVYALGAWTIVGCLLYGIHSGRFKTPAERPVKKKEEETSSRFKEVYENDYMKFVVTYKSDRVPYIYRLYGSIQAYFDQTKPGR